MGQAQSVPVEQQNATSPGQRGRARDAKMGPRSVGSFVSEALQANKGVSKASAARLFKRVAAASPLPMGRLRAELIPDSTWKRARGTLGPQASQTVARVRHALSLAEHVWGNETDAMEWLTNPHLECGARLRSPF